MPISQNDLKNQFLEIDSDPFNFKPEPIMDLVAGGILNIEVSKF